MQTNTNNDSLFETDKRLLFLLLCLISFLILFTKKTFIENQTAAFEFLQDRPEGVMLGAIELIQYVTIPLIYLWKFTVIGFVIWLGSFTFGYRITFTQCWGIALAGEYVFLIPEIIKNVWFLFFESDPTYKEIVSFYPLSLATLIDLDTISKAYAYPLKALNLFEIIYWYILTLGLQAHVKIKQSTAWKIILSSYGILFCGWLLFYIAVYR
ncbi:MAG: hypothetical protein RIB47_07660 [Cyclobacteriaceae bacterium]